MMTFMICVIVAVMIALFAPASAGAWLRRRLVHQRDSWSKVIRPTQKVEAFDKEGNPLN